MQYKCCEYLLHQIVFDIDNIKPCCEVSMNNESINLITDARNTNFDIEYYFNERNKIKNIFKNGDIPNACLNCPMIKEYNWDKQDEYIDRIIIANMPKCSCNCIYCVYTHDNPKNKNIFNKLQPYNIKPILKTLLNKNLLNDKLLLIIGGGECTEYDKGELEWLLYFTLAMNCKIQILSSGIKDSESIKKMLRVGNVELCISPDSGTKNTYEKIKRVKAYNQVWQNLEKYVQSANLNPNARVEIKYIIIPDINDNIAEINAFIKKCEEIQCFNIHIDIEHFWFSKNKDKQIPNNIKQIINLLNEAKDFSISYSIETENWIKN